MKREYLKEIFYVLTAAIVIFLVLEIIHPKLILAYLNLNWVLILWLFIGIVLVVTKNKKYINE